MTLHRFEQIDERIILAILGFLSFTPVFVDDALDGLKQNPDILGTHTLEAISILAVAYHFIASPLYKKIVQFVQAINVYLTTGVLPGKPKS